MIFSACLSGADAPSSRHWPLQWFRECESTNKRSREPERDSLNNSREQNWRLCSNDTVQVKVTYHELMIRFSWMTKKAHGATRATTNHRKMSKWPENWTAKPCTVDGVNYSMPDSEFACQSACRKRECEKSLLLTFRQFWAFLTSQLWKSRTRKIMKRS